MFGALAYACVKCDYSAFGAFFFAVRNLTAAAALHVRIVLYQTSDAFSYPPRWKTSPLAGFRCCEYPFGFFAYVLVRDASHTICHTYAILSLNECTRQARHALIPFTSFFFSSPIFFSTRRHAMQVFANLSRNTFHTISWYFGHEVY